VGSIGPWIDDAVHLRDLEDVNSFRQHLMLDTSPITAFLDATSEGRDTQFIVMAPKGFGKTLVLKAKRLAIEKHHPGTLLFPQKQLVDSLSGNATEMSRSYMNREASRLNFWKGMWLVSISLAVIQNYERSLLSHMRTKFSNDLRDETIPSTVTDIFQRLLLLSQRERADIIKICQVSTRPIYRDISRPIATFIDNIDDYFTTQPPEDWTIALATRNLNRRVWVVAQIGLVAAIRELRGINQNIQIFAAVRREAIHIAPRITPTATQIRGICLDLSYTKEQLRQIVENNIQLMPKIKLFESDDVLSRLVGTDNAELSHRYTQRREPIFEFFFRHSLGRPRDFMMFGKQLASIDLPAHRSADQIRNVVFKESKKIIEAYYTDMKPFVPVPHEQLYPYIHKNVLTMEELRTISSQYTNQMHKMQIATNSHPFCALFRLGLLGILELDADGHFRQRFMEPDEFTNDRDDHLLPYNTKFLIHPALDDLIHDWAQQEYIVNFEKLNTIGHGLPWEEVADRIYLVRGDIVGSSDAIYNPELTDRYKQLFDEIVSAVGAQLRYCRSENGDQVLMIDGSPVALLLVANKLATRLNEFAQFPRELRFAAFVGQVKFRDEREPDGGVALRGVARVLEHARAGLILATDEFVRGVLKFGFEQTKIRRLLPEDLPGVLFIDGKFRIQKNKSDVPIDTELWEIPAHL
jgi:hypothetical protein